jgi:Domain of unknown function (DUF4177)
MACSRSEPAALRARPTVAGSLPPVTTWDYTTSVITHGFLGRKEEELDRAEFERAMNELGADGWELATAFLDVALHREKDGHVLVFKRRHE